MAVVNGNIIESVRTLVSVACEEMCGESERLEAAESICNIPAAFKGEIFLLKNEVEKVRDILGKIQRDTMTTTKGKIKAAQISVRLETLILSERE